MQRTFQAIVGSDKIAAERTGLSFTPQFVRALWPTLREASETVYLSCFVRQSAFAVAVHETVYLSVCVSSSRLKISPTKSKQATHNRQIKSCSLIYLERIALSELANCMTAIRWPRSALRSVCFSCIPPVLNYQNYTFAS